MLHRIQTQYDHRKFLIVAYILFWTIGCLAGTVFAAQEPVFIMDAFSGMITRPYLLIGHFGCVALIVIIVFTCLYFSVDSLLFFYFFMQGFCVCFCGRVLSLAFQSAGWLIYLLLSLPQLLLSALLVFLILHLSHRNDGITVVSAVVFAVISILLLSIYAFEFVPFISALR